MDDKETLNRRARLRELVLECFNNRDADILRHIENRTGKKPNQGEFSAIQRDHGGKPFGDKKAKNLTEQIGLHRSWFNMPVGSNIDPLTWMNEIVHTDHSKSINEPVEYAFDKNVIAGPSIRGEVPLISWVQAGAWSDVVDNFSPGDSEEMIPTIVPIKRHTFALRVDGDSMTNPAGWPSFPEGMIIIVEPEFDHQSGDFVVVKNGENQATFKQLIRDGAEWLLKPLNPRYPIKPLPTDSTICGVVRGYGGIIR